MKTALDGTVLLETLQKEGARFMLASPSNRMGEAWGDERIWDSPLQGAARGDDPLFESFKETVDPRHMTPAEAFAAGGFEGEAAELAVVSWILPHSSITKQDNAREKEMPSERWARSRIFGEKASAAFRAHITAFLKDAGIDAVAPFDLPVWKSLESERYVFASNWSERHIAHACGLGTFGLCDGLITPVGKAVRICSVVLRGQIEPAPRPYTRYDEYCSFKMKGACGVCVKRCPVGAISDRGHDKRLCKAHANIKTAEYVREHYDFEGYGCGLCQTGVPCADGIPKGL